MGRGFAGALLDLLLTRESQTPENAVFLAPLPYEQEDYLCDLLEELDSDVTCNAQLTKLVHCGYDLYLDIARPAKLLES